MFEDLRRGRTSTCSRYKAWSAAKDAISYVNKDNSDFALPATNEEVLKFIDLDEE